MLLAVMALLALQADKPAAGAETPRRDIYTECFLRELSALEGRDVANSRDGFSRQNGVNALQRCRPARDQLTAEVEAVLAADPAFSDPRLRAVELENRVMLAELPLLTLIRALGR